MFVCVYLVNKSFKPFKHTEGVGSHSVGLIQLSYTFAGTFVIGFILFYGSFIVTLLRIMYGSPGHLQGKREVLVTPVQEADGIDEDGGDRA